MGSTAIGSERKAKANLISIRIRQDEVSQDGDRKIVHYKSKDDGKGFALNHEIGKEITDPAKLWLPVSGTALRVPIFKYSLLTTEPGDVMVVSLTLMLAIQELEREGHLQVATRVIFHKVVGNSLYFGFLVFPRG